MNDNLVDADEHYGKRQKTSNSNSPSGHREKTLETDGPVKDKDYKVLHKDGSFATDLPGKGAEGSGALEGTVGLGT